MLLLEVFDGDGHGFVMVVSGYVDMKNGIKFIFLSEIAVQPYFSLLTGSAQGVDPLHLVSNLYKKCTATYHNGILTSRNCAGIY